MLNLAHFSYMNTKYCWKDEKYFDNMLVSDCFFNNGMISMKSMKNFTFFILIYFKRIASQNHGDSLTFVVSEVGGRKRDWLGWELGGGENLDIERRNQNSWLNCSPESCSQYWLVVFKNNFWLVTMIGQSNFCA